MRNIWTVPHRLTDDPGLCRLEACQLSDNISVLTKVENCEVNVSVMFHVVRTPSSKCFYYTTAYSNQSPCPDKQE